MSEPKGYIANRSNKKSEFELLFEESIEIIQKLASDEWTDYNEHDPGVTIIENLVYALTSLNYKSQFPVEDILVSGKGSALESGDNGFFEASDILTTNPITDKDLRKLFIDRILNVKNVWVDRVVLANEGEEIAHLHGVVNLYVELYDYEDGSLSFAKEKARVIREIREVYHQQRNLCEDLHNVEVLMPLALDVKLNLSIQPDQNGEEVMARVLYEIDNYFSNNVKFHSLEDLQQKGTPTHEIFSGPKLNNGFIPDTELGDKLSIIVPSEVVRILSKLKGIISVNRLEIIRTEEYEEQPLTDDDRWKIEPGRIPRLSFPTQRESFVFKMNNTSFSPNLEEVRKQLSYIEAVNFGSMRSTSQANNRLDIPAGNQLDLQEYLPVRHQFPVVYGIGEFGLAKNEPVERFAQVEQLKAFLLPFDQLMANGLAQLNTIYELYNMKSTNATSYAFQVLEDMPKHIRLIEDQKNQDADKTLATWGNKLQQINERFDTTAVDRLNRVINSLLARFSEAYPSYELQKIYYDSYGKELAEKQFASDALAWKRKFAQSYGAYSYNRSKGRNYLSDIKENKLPAHVSGILKRVCGLLGIQNDALYPLSDIIQEQGINVYKTEDGHDILGEKLLPVYYDDEGNTISAEDVVIINESVENLWNSFYYIGNSEDILKSVLREGVDVAKYAIKKSEGREQLYYITFSTSHGTTNAVHVSGTKQDADQAVQEATQFLLEINKKSEGIYMLEHILLAPPYLEDFFGFTFEIISDNQQPLEFKQVKKASLNQRNETIQQLTGLAGADLTFETILENSKYVIRAYANTGEQLAESTQRFPDDVTANEWITAISGEHTTIRLSNFTCHAFYGENKVDESFFTLKMSFILPDWPSRFQDHNFRMQLGDIVYENAPVHIASYTHWISINEMAEFEKLYFTWLRLPHGGSFNQELMEISYQLIQKLEQYAAMDG